MVSAAPGGGTCWNESAKYNEICCEMAFTYGSAWADDDTRVHALLVAIGALSAVSTLVLLEVLVLRHGGLLLSG
jgi:hypothetical protein